MLLLERKGRELEHTAPTTGCTDCSFPEHFGVLGHDDGLQVVSVGAEDLSDEKKNKPVVTLDEETLKAGSRERLREFQGTVDRGESVRLEIKLVRIRPDNQATSIIVDDEFKED